MGSNSKALRIGKKVLSFVLAFGVVLSLGTGLLSTEQNVSAAKLKTKYEQILDESERESAYSAYLRRYEDEKSPIASIDIPINETTAISGGAVLKEDCLTEDGTGEGVVFEGQGSVTYTINVEKKGMYKISIGYYTFGDDSRNIDLTLKFNGEIPFSSMSKYSITRLWKDATDIVPDDKGNDSRPKLEQDQKWREFTLTDLEGIADHYYFFFDKGENTITIDIAREGFVLTDLVVFNNEETIPYSEYIASVGSNPVNYFQLIEAERYTNKSNSSIIQASDRSGPDTSPNDPIALKINTISGDSWKIPGDYLTYTFDVPEDGNYYFGYRFRQNTIKGMFVTRKVLIDGNEAPFAEYEDVKFKFSDNWQYIEPSDANGNPYYVYLEKGTHTISLQVTVGDAAYVIRELQDLIYVMNYLYRRITMITSASPDIYRDYHLTEDIPELIPTFENVVVKLDEIYKYLVDLSGSAGGNAVVLTQMSDMLKDFIEDDFLIPERLSAYNSNVSSVSSLLTLLQTQPMALDYITVMGEGTAAQNPKHNFFERLWYHICAFFGSFFSDYSMLGKELSGSKVIDVWYSGGREQAEIVRRMIDDDFTPNTGISVNLKLVQLSLTNAIIAGQAPDVVMNVSRGMPVNLGARKALEDLSQFADYAEVMKRFADGADIPYSFEGKSYGIPVTQNFYLLFTRDDVLDELDLEVPQTWEDVYKAISVLQRNNMYFGLPYTTMSSQGTIDAGMGSKDIFPTLLYQHGGKFYADDNRSTALEEEAAIDAFVEWTEFYTDYGLDVSYDFYNRFRTGEMPIGISGFGMYNTLDTAAPEIRGMWSMHLIPGTPKYNEDGTPVLNEDGTQYIDRTTAGSGSATVMVKGVAEEKKDAAWTFMKWWTGQEAQVRYGTEIEILMGSASRYDTANIAAMEFLPWADSELETINAQRKWVREVDEVPGGYYTSRNLDNAFRNVVFNGLNPRESLLEQNISTNAEITKKRKEFGLDE